MHAILAVLFTLMTLPIILSVNWGVLEFENSIGSGAHQLGDLAAFQY